MTFVLGMHCMDGMALFADTLESGGAVKRYRQKIHWQNVIAGWGIAWGVAGNALVADKFSEKLRALVGTEDYDRYKTELIVEKCLKLMRQQYAGSEEDIEVIVGICGTPPWDHKSNAVYLPNPEAHLYRGDSLTACLAPVNDYCIAGMDVTLAAFLLRAMRNPFLRMDEALRLGVFTTAVMKEYASGVDGDTNVCIHKIGTQGWVPLLDREITVIETDFPVSAIEEHTTSFWVNHPKARKDSEINASDLRMRAIKQRKAKPSASRKSKSVR
jgi:hypothetical protein